MEINRPKRRPTNIDGFVVPEIKQLDLTSRPQPIVKTKKLSAIKFQDIDSTPIAKVNDNLKTFTPLEMSTNTLKTKKPNKKKIIWLSIIAIVLLAVGGAAWDAWQLYHKLHKLDVGNLAASVGGAENILVAGSTNRCDQKVQNAQWGFCSQKLSGVNSDIIFVVHLVPKTQTVSLLSIPRDTFVPNARKNNEAFKIDAALYQGPSQLVAAIEQDFGIPIQHYAEVGFDGFVNIVNAVGGVKVNFPMPVYDSESYLNVSQPGCHELNGLEALQVIRARHLQYKPASVTTNNVNYWPQESLSDIARIARTHEFLKILAQTVAAKGVSNPITDQKLIDAIAPQVQVDSGFSTSTMLEILQDFHATNVNSTPQYTLPIVTTGFGSYDYEGENMGDVVFPIEQTDEQIIDKFLGTNANVNTMTGNTLPAPQSVNINVINGSGVANQAANISDGLQKIGFNIASQPTSKTPVSYQAQETVVEYANQAAEGAALTVASKLSGYVILSQNSTMVSSGSEVTVLTGSDVSVIGQTAPSGSATGSSTVSSSSSASSRLGPVSQPQTPLAPWDPTACSPNQKVIPNNPNI